MASSCRYVPKYGSTSVCDQNCGVQSADRQIESQTYATRTDKSLKTEGPKILSNDIFYFGTEIIGDPIKLLSRLISFTIVLPPVCVANHDVIIRRHQG